MPIKPGNAATSDKVIEAALKALPNNGALLDEDISGTPDAVTVTEVEPQYSFDEDEQPGAVATQQAATTPPPAPAATAPPVEPQGGAAPGAQPVAAPAPVSTAQTAIVTPGAGASDPWAEYEEIEYVDDDGGKQEKYVVRAPKSYADKVKNGYARRSVMDRNAGWLGQYRKLIEPMVTNKQFADVAPIIERGLGDQEFAQFISQAYMRRLNGLPLEVHQQAPAVAPVQQAQVQAPSSADALLAGIDKVDVDDYTKDAFKALITPLVQEIGALRTHNQTIETRTQEQQQRAAQAAQIRQRELALGTQMRNALMSTYPDEFNDRTPSDQFTAVLNYADKSGMFQQYGRSPATIVLAAQALKNPLGLHGLRAAPAASVAAQTIADVQRQGERAAAAAAGAVAQQVAPASGAGGTQTERPVQAAKAPRWIVDRRTGKKRPITSKELGEWLAKHPEAV